MPDVSDFEKLRSAMEAYAPLSSRTRESLFSFCISKDVRTKEHLVTVGSIPNSLYFVVRGLFRIYTTGENGKEFNKNFFAENMFPGSIVALLRGEPSDFGIQALEHSRIIVINFAAYRKLLQSSDDLKWWHIQYLEKNWIIEREAQEVSLVLNSASERYRNFREKHPGLVDRIPLHHIASRLGITPTQLSRLRRGATEK